MTVLKTETETAVFSRNTDRNRPSSDDPEPLQHYICQSVIIQTLIHTSTIFNISFNQSTFPKLPQVRS